MTASRYSCLSGCLALIFAPCIKGCSSMDCIASSLRVQLPNPPLNVTLHLTSLITLLTLASQKAPLYFADTCVPMANETGFSPWKK